MSEKVENRNRVVLESAIEIAREYGMARLTRQHVADVAGVSCGSVNNAFGTMEALRDAVMATAVAREILGIVAQGLAERHPAALAAPADVRQRAVSALAG